MNDVLPLAATREQNSQGEQLRQQGRATEALKAYDAVLTIVRGSADNRSEAIALAGRSDALRMLGRFAEALEAGNSALVIYRKLADRAGEEESLIAIGTALRMLSRDAEALASHDAALHISRELGDPAAEAKALYALGGTLRVLDRYAEALEHHIGALEIYRTIGDKRGEGGCSSAMGADLRMLNRNAEALKAQESAIALLEEAGERRGQAIAVNGRGFALRNLDRREEALAAHEDAITIFRQVGDVHGEGSALHGKGIVLRILGRAVESLEPLELALSLLRKTGDRRGEASVLGSRGNALRALARAPEALEMHEKALAIFGDIGDRHGAANAQELIAADLQLLARTGDAIIALDSAHQAYREMNDLLGEANVQIGRGRVLAQSGNREASANAFHEALKISQGIGYAWAAKNALAGLKALEGEPSGGASKRILDLEKELRELRATLGEEVLVARTNSAEQKRRADELDATLGEISRKSQVEFLLQKICPDAHASVLASDELRSAFASPAPRRLVAMSVDIRRSTDLMLKARSPQSFAGFITVLCKRLMDIVWANHGVVDKFTGDGILAFFPEFFSGEDAAYYAVMAADACHKAFADHYAAHRTSFQTVLSDIGLGIGLDYGDCHLVRVAGSLTIVGAPVVYACRLGAAPAGFTLLNQPAYEVVSERHGGRVHLTETTIDIKHEGPLIAYKAVLAGGSYEPRPPTWANQTTQPLSASDATERVQTM